MAIKKIDNSIEGKPDNPEARLAIWWAVGLHIALVIVLCLPFLADLMKQLWSSQLWSSIAWNFELVKSLPDNCFPAKTLKDMESIAIESCSAIIRNFGLMVGIGLSFIIAIFGLLLALWGRITQRGQWKTEEKKLDLENKQWELQRRQLEIQDKQQELHKREKLQERFENASDMLAGDAELTRISACRSLADLGIADESLKVRCVHLLFTFINNPYLETNDKDKSLDELFPANKPLRPDIQQAIASFSAIYEHYGDSGIDYKAVKLPNYFWKNEHKDSVCLIDANLIGKNLKEIILNRTNLKKTRFAWSNLEGADLSFANLERADLQHSSLVGANLAGTNLKQVIFLGANLRKVNLLYANLEDSFLDVKSVEGVDFLETNLKGTYISGLDMRETVNLTKEQILSAKWAYDRFPFHSGPPQLPESLRQDEDIKKWLESPDFDNRESEASE